MLWGNLYIPWGAEGHYCAHMNLALCTSCPPQTNSTGIIRMTIHSLGLFAGGAWTLKSNRSMEGLSFEGGGHPKQWWVSQIKRVKIRVKKIKNSLPFLPVCEPKRGYPQGKLGNWLSHRWGHNSLVLGLPVTFWESVLSSTSSGSTDHLSIATGFFLTACIRVRICLFSGLRVYCLSLGQTIGSRGQALCRFPESMCSNGWYRMYTQEVLNKCSSENE